MPFRRWLGLLLETDDPGEAVSGLADDVLASMVRRSIADSFGSLLCDDDQSALWLALDRCATISGRRQKPDKGWACRSAYDTLRSEGAAAGVEYDEFETAFLSFVTAINEAFLQLREPWLLDLPCRELSGPTLAELSRTETADDLSRCVTRLARRLEGWGALSQDDVDHLAGLAEKMAAAPGYLRFLSAEKKREEIACLSGMLLSVRTSGAGHGVAASDMAVALGLLFYGILPSDDAAACLARVRPSQEDSALSYHYYAVMALSHLLAGRPETASGNAGMAKKKAAEPGSIAYVSILEGCIAIRQGDYQRALARLQEAGACAPDDRQRALASFYRGIVLFEMNEHAQALRCFEAAGACLAEPVDLMSVQNNVGACAMHLGDMPRAERAFAEIERLSRLLKGDRAGRCQLATSSYAGAIQQARGDYPRAIERYQLALKLALRSNDRRTVASQLGNLGAAFAGAGDSERAFRFLEACMSYSEQAGYRAGIRFAGWHIHRLLLENGRRNEARQFRETYSVRYPELRNLR